LDQNHIHSQHTCYCFVVNISNDYYLLESFGYIALYIIYNY